MAYEIKLVKSSQRSLNETVIIARMDHAIQRVVGGGRGKVWSAKRGAITNEQNGENFLYTASIKLKRIGRQAAPEKLDAQVARMQEIAEAAVRSQGWAILGQGQDPAQVQPEQKPLIQPSEIITIPGEHFGHLYGLDPQIELVLSSLREYTRSEWQNRFHVVLHGAPASGKTEILRSLSKMVGPDAVMHFDATSTTAAGAKQLLI
jgi:hypothetical protein